MKSNIFERFNPGVVMVAISLAMLPFNLWAAERNDNLHASGIGTDPFSSNYLVQLVTGLIIVMLCIVVLAWLAKRFNRLRSSSDGSMRILDGISMGARERLVVVKVGSARLLLGVSPGRINMLHVLDQPLENEIDESDKPLGKSFSERLHSALSQEK